jgi:hypothetical protein
MAAAIDALSVAELRAYLRQAGADTSGCFEKVTTANYRALSPNDHWRDRWFVRCRPPPVVPVCLQARDRVSEGMISFPPFPASPPPASRFLHLRPFNGTLVLYRIVMHAPLFGTRTLPLPLRYRCAGAALRRF